MKLKGVACVVGLMALGACAAFPAESPYPSPGSLTPSTTVASQGSVFFVSPTEAWELTQPPDQLHTVVLRTMDAGAHWKIWGIAPEAGGPLGFSPTEVVLSTYQDILRSSDGTHWIIKRLPTFGTPMFLPDLQHGWVGGFPIFFAAPSPSPTVPSGKGGPPPGGKGGGGRSAPAGKGGSTAAAPPTTCQDKGCAPIDLYSTSDGGSTWHFLFRSIVSVDGGPMYFFSPNVGLIEQNATLLLTRDGGATWHRQTFSIPGVTSDQPANDLAPTMFDGKNGVLPVQAATGIYLLRTVDGGLTWSAPQRVNDCAGCSGQQMTFLDSQHWIDYSQGVNFTSDGGQTWTKVNTTNPSKTVSGVELAGPPSSAVFVFAPGLFASESTDWGAHWRAVALPDIYPTYRGFAGEGGWTGP